MTTSDARVMTRIQQQSIDITHYLSKAASSAHGAISIFVGVVRDNDPLVGERQVTSIEYVAHPQAEVILQREVENVVSSLPNVRAIVIHRVGVLKVGESALLAVVSTPHRDPAMQLVPAIVERVKETLPVWKRQILADGTTLWSNLP